MSKVATYLMSGKSLPAAAPASSVIAAGSPTVITVTWSEALTASGSTLANGFRAVVAGAAVTIASVVHAGTTTTITLAAPVTAGQAVQWQFDSTSGVKLIGKTTKVRTNSYTVANNVV